MGNAEHILVVVLASALAVFLILGIVALILLIRVLRHLNKISEKAERLATTAESVGEFFKYTAGPAAVGKLVSNIVDTVRNRDKKTRWKD